MTLLEQKINEGVLTLTLNRPDKRNALNEDLLTALSAALIEAKTNKHVKVVLLRGHGACFCAGADISRLADCDAQTGLDFARMGQHVFRQLETLGKPSLAAIHGTALGGGCELAMAATFRMASSCAKFGQPEVKLGVIPGYGGTQRLARLVGKGRALDLCLSGRFIDADTALNWGLVNEVVALESLEEVARGYLLRVAAMAPLALAAVMDVVDRGYDLPLEEALHLEALQFARVCASQDKHEGVAAFLEKRVAVFHGR